MSLENLLTYLLEEDDGEFTIVVMLTAAIWNGDEQMVSMILSHDGLTEGETKGVIMWVAARYTTRCLTPAILNLMIANGLPVNNYEYAGADGRQLINCDAILKNRELVKILLENDSDVDRIPEEYPDEPPLEKALAYGYYESAKLLMKHGADINQEYVTHRGDTNIVCYRAMYHKGYMIDWELIEFMLDSGADLSDPDKLRECCRSDEIIERIEDRINLNRNHNRGGCTVC